jgi:hypothetical protein
LGQDAEILPTGKMSGDPGKNAKLGEVKLKYKRE